MNNQISHQKLRELVKVIVARLFKDIHGDPYQITDGQCDIFIALTNPAIKWVWTSAPTRYGKSETIALACIYLAVFHKLKIPIVAGSADKANKIMEYIIQHLSDHTSLHNDLINLKDIKKIEKLKIAVSKDALKWSKGGWIYITSIDSRSIIKEGEGVVGEGGDVVILEEAGLIRRQEQFSKVVRMVEGDWGKLVMSGNCIENSVFEEAYNNPVYHKVHIKLQQAIDEGRINESRLEEQKKQTTSKDWKRYYEVEFPAENEFTYFKPTKYDDLPDDLLYYGALDPALGENLKGSLAAIVVLGKSKSTGEIYEVQSDGELWTPDETINEIFKLPFKFQRFGIEAIQFQKYFLKVVSDKSKLLGKYIPFEGIEQQKKKEERIESLEPFINTAQIRFKGGNKLWKHMQDYPEPEHLDILDTLEMVWRLVQGSTKLTDKAKTEGKARMQTANLMNQSF